MYTAVVTLLFILCYPYLESGGTTGMATMAMAIAIALLGLLWPQTVLAIALFAIGLCTVYTNLNICSILSLK